MDRKLIFICSLLILFFAVSNCWALHTYAYANVYRDQHGANLSDSDEDYGVQSCSSFAYVACDQCPTYATGQASAQRTARGGLLMSHSTDGDIGTVGESYTCGAGADGYGRGEYGDYVIGPGSDVTVGLNLANVSLSVNAADLLATTTISFDLQVDEMSVQSGSASLSYDGIFSGDGSYVESFFDVCFDGMSNSWKAEYTGPVTLPASFPVDSFFDVYFEITVEKVYGGGGGGVFSPEITNGTQNLELVIPEGYELVPEPTTMALFGLGALSLLRKRR